MTMMTTVACEKMGPMIAGEEQDRGHLHARRAATVGAAARGSLSDPILPQVAPHVHSTNLFHAPASEENFAMPAPVAHQQYPELCQALNILVDSLSQIQDRKARKELCRAVFLLGTHKQGLENAWTQGATREAGGSAPRNSVNVLNNHGGEINFR